jgi:hypothetical protein
MTPVRRHSKEYFARHRPAAAFNSQDIGTSRWQLMIEHFTTERGQVFALCGFGRPDVDDPDHRRRRLLRPRHERPWSVPARGPAGTLRRWQAGLDPVSYLAPTASAISSCVDRLPHGVDARLLRASLASLSMRESQSRMVRSDTARIFPIATQTISCRDRSLCAMSPRPPTVSASDQSIVGSVRRSSATLLEKRAAFRVFSIGPHATSQFRSSVSSGLVSVITIVHRGGG